MRLFAEFAEDRTPSIRVNVQNGTPRLVNFSGRTYCVRRVLQQWQETERALLGDQERACYLLETYENTLEVHRTGEDWHLARVMVDSFEGEVLPRLAA